MMKKPNELSNLFSDSDFEKYPFVRIPQEFKDERGIIQNIADGAIGDVAVITSNSGSIRANHVHSDDWHLTYIVSGSMKYHWVDVQGINQNTIVNKAEMVFTPSRTPHKMEFLTDSVFIAISKLNRSHEKYEADTKKIDLDFFKE
jgi:dTDP-4-dehydrorhamnose 3,5-epimerase-like enzyme